MHGLWLVKGPEILAGGTQLEEVGHEGAGPWGILVLAFP